MEALSLQRWQLHLSARRLVAHLPHSKSGQRKGCEELVAIDDPGLVTAVVRLLTRLPPCPALLQRSVPEFRRAFDHLLGALHLQAH
eukprot:7930052-Alexandrium_andersonii.AAC.1